MSSRRRDSGDPELPLYEVSTDRLRLVFLPSVGGRLLSLSVDGRELLWRNPAFFDADLRAVRRRSEWAVVDGTFASWSNIGGSKSWPAPQGWAGEGEWPGPPDPVLDSGSWSWAEVPGADGGTVVTMTSADDPRTGLRMRRRFDIPASGVTFTENLELRNVSPRVVRWAPWEVCQVDTTPDAGEVGLITVAVSGDAEPIDQGRYVGDVSWTRRAGAIDLPVQDVVAKVGFSDASGSLVWRAPDGAGLSLDWIPAAGVYPDCGARAEIWMQAPIAAPIAELSGLHPDAHLAELEVLGPLAQLGPGETTSCRITWSASMS